MTSAEIAPYQPPPAPVIADMDSWIGVCSDVIKVANVICDTPFVPDGLRGSGPAVAAAILAGRELSLGPMTSLANIHVIKGKPALSAVLMRALIQGAGHQWEDVEVTDTRAVIRAKRRGEAEWTTVSFTADQARHARIDLGGYPQDKLYARATSRLARRKFADVIAGMPYSAEELEDGDTGEDGAPAESNGHKPAEKAAPRTARRRTPANAAPPAPTPAPAASGPRKPADGAPLPPLPGEDEAPSGEPPAPDGTDYDTPGTVTRPQLTAIWTVLRQVFKFTDEEKDQARAVAAHIIGRPLESTRQMSKNEAGTILDTLANWQETAAQRGEEPRELLIAYMAAGDQDAAGAGSDE